MNLFDVTVFIALFAFAFFCGWFSKGSVLDWRAIELGRIEERERMRQEEFEKRRKAKWKGNGPLRVTLHEEGLIHFERED